MYRELRQRVGTRTRPTPRGSSNGNKEANKNNYKQEENLYKATGIIWVELKVGDRLRVIPLYQNNIPFEDILMDKNYWMQRGSFLESRKLSKDPAFRELCEDYANGEPYKVVNVFSSRDYLDFQQKRRQRGIGGLVGFAELEKEYLTIEDIKSVKQKAEHIAQEIINKSIEEKKEIQRQEERLTNIIEDDRSWAKVLSPKSERRFKYDSLDKGSITMFESMDHMDNYVIKNAVEIISQIDQLERDFTYIEPEQVQNGLQTISRVHGLNISSTDKIQYKNYTIVQGYDDDIIEQVGYDSSGKEVYRSTLLSKDKCVISCKDFKITKNNQEGKLSLGNGIKASKKVYYNNEIVYIIEYPNGNTMEQSIYPDGKISVTKTFANGYRIVKDNRTNETRIYKDDVLLATQIRTGARTETVLKDGKKIVMEPTQKKRSGINVDCKNIIVTNKKGDKTIQGEVTCDDKYIDPNYGSDWFFSGISIASQGLPVYSVYFLKYTVKAQSPCPVGIYEVDNDKVVNIEPKVTLDTVVVPIVVTNWGYYIYTPTLGDANEYGNGYISEKNFAENFEKFKDPKEYVRKYAFRDVKEHVDKIVKERLGDIEKQGNISCELEDVIPYIELGQELQTVCDENQIDAKIPIELSVKNVLSTSRNQFSGIMDHSEQIENIVISAEQIYNEASIKEAIASGKDFEKQIEKTAERIKTIKQKEQGRED